MEKRQYRIRAAQLQDLVFLPDIERAAADQFCSTPYSDLGEVALVSEHVDIATEYVWVVVEEQDHPVGFAIVHDLGEVIHLHELDVHPAHARQGLGRQLIETVSKWARAQGKRAITLTTFSDVPWNGPYYARLGFRILKGDEITEVLKVVQQEELDAGMPMKNRICMQLDL